MKLRNLVISALIVTGTALSVSAPLQAVTQIDGPTGGSFTVLDRRADDEVSEVSRLYVNGTLATTFVLSMNHDSQQVVIPVPLGRVDVPYVLCGEITINRNGHIETHRVSSEGKLHNPAGHSYEAVGTDNFNDFYLIDYDDPDAATHKSGRSSLCSLPTS
ncbi:hypothetical protein PT277_06155 [Acetobacteraceae bacterium ESL0709]|nr:hypothetical protein [Acetobacteraceae bacterium ESL0697]MDF7678281.1 hypothetical protein [Acetobacteraceae bacterium ESL0709]